MTPGVYLVEKDAFPPSVATVPTAIPAFVGYTEFAVVHGKPPTQPVLISSLAEYETHFGGAAPLRCSIRKAEQANPPHGVTIDGQAYVIETSQPTHVLRLYRSLQLFFMNGGDQCYVVSIGQHFSEQRPDASSPPERTPTIPSKDDFIRGLEQLTQELYPSPTMLLTPDALSLSKEDYYAVQQEALRQCGRLRDRIAIVDVHGGDKPLDSGVVDDLRTMIGTESLDYGASYYPFLNTDVVAASEPTYGSVDSTAEGAVSLATLFPNEAALADGSGMLAVLWADRAAVAELIVPPPLALDVALPSTLRHDSTGATYSTWEAASNAAPQDGTDEARLRWRARVVLAMAMVLAQLDRDSTVASTGATIGDATLKRQIKTLTSPTSTAATSLAAVVSHDQNYPGGALDVVTTRLVQALFPGITIPDTTPYASGDAPTIATASLERAHRALASAFGQVVDAAKTLHTSGEQALTSGNADYKALMAAIAERAGVLPPGPAMAGVMASVDNAQGVWSAPANVNINSVTAPAVSVDNEEQQTLNIDVTTGKSVNPIRTFAGRGPAIVWGARTLDGNSPDWRYINVRRTVIMLEQSIKNAIMQYVFSPNDTTTWSTITSVIESFLSSLWSQGALHGATASDAFSVQAGLGQTMTPQDVQNEILRVAVKVAIVHPGEFMVITYEQEMATP